jgi:hypothetical protein
MSPIALLPDLPGCCIEQVSSTEEMITITAHATASSACCPDCQQPSARVHSYYRRSPMTLPSSGRPVRLLLEVRRFRCPKSCLWAQDLRRAVAAARGTSCPTHPRSARPAACPRRSGRWGSRSTPEPAIGDGMQPRYPPAIGSPRPAARVFDRARAWGR